MFYIILLLNEIHESYGDTMNIDSIRNKDFNKVPEEYPTSLTNQIYIYGAGKYGKMAFDYSRGKFNITAFVDKHAEEGLSEYCSKPVISKTELLSIKEDITVIIAIAFPSEILQTLTDYKNINLYLFNGKNPDAPFIYKVENNDMCHLKYFDKVYEESDFYSKHYSELKYTVKMFEKAIEWLQTKIEKNVDICEIACGSGQFANMLFDNGFTDYIGFDFSSTAIELAKKTNPKYSDKFICANAFSFLESYKPNNKVMFFCFEMLEHIDKDIELLEILPKEVDIIFSVPNFKSFNHLRTFGNIEDIRNRYTMLNLVDYKIFPSNHTGKDVWHLVYAKRK